MSVERCDDINYDQGKAANEIHHLKYPNERKNSQVANRTQLKKRFFFVLIVSLIGSFVLLIQGKENENGTGQLTLITKAKSNDDWNSVITEDDQETIINYIYHLAPQLLLAPEIVIKRNISKESDAEDVVRGIGTASVSLKNAKLVAGRWFQSDRQELVVVTTHSDTAERQLDVGNTKEIAGEPWEVVGAISSLNLASKTEFWTSLENLTSEVAEHGQVQVIYLSELSRHMRVHLRNVFEDKGMTGIRVIAINNVDGERFSSTELYIFWGVLVALLLMMLWRIKKRLQSFFGSRVRDVRNQR